MPKFNLYKIKKEKETDLHEKLLSVGLSITGQKDIGNFNLSFYLSTEPYPVSIWWTDLYREFLPAGDIPKNLAYFAVLVISSADLCYAISMGKSHFYLKDFCDINFGINLAERIVDEKHFRLKNSKLFGGKRNKTIVAYQENSELEFDSGESIQFMKAKTIDPSAWGEIASFGNSVLLNKELTPDDLPDLILMIEEKLEDPPIMPIPRATAVTDPTKLEELDRKLVEAINSTHGGSSIQAAEPTVSGVDFIFLNKSNYRFIFNYRGEDISGELTVEALRDYAARNSIDMMQEINNIKIKVFDETGHGFSHPVKFFLDYADDERCFLLDGIWHEFNQNYIDFLKKQVDDRIELETISLDLSSSACEAWRTGLDPDEAGKPNYAEVYFNLQRESEGYLNCDRHTTVLSGFQIEKLDLWKDKTAFFVKIGKPQKLGYAVDQAMATIKVLQNAVDSIHIDGQNIKPDRICIWLILDRVSRISKLSDINSLILLIKLAEWQRHCANAGYKAVVRIGYKVA